MENEYVMEIAPLFLWDQSLQLTLDFLRRGRRRVN